MFELKKDYHLPQKKTILKVPGMFTVLQPSTLNTISIFLSLTCIKKKRVPTGKTKNTVIFFFFKLNEKLKS
jgi:hypothetical protein